MPLTKTLEAFGQWPSMLTRMGRPPPISRGFEGYVPTTHDVIACSYFKSGTNLLLQMAVQIANRARTQFNHIHDLVPWPESTAAGYAIPVEDETPWRASPTGLRVIKTHKLAAGVPMTDAARYIVVVRDPKSVLVSGYLFSKALIFGPMMPSINHWADLFMSSRFPFGPWPEHVAGYWKLRSRPNVLIATYEEMTEDPGATVRRVAQFMNVVLSAATSRTTRSL
ncbi:MAG TPA: sulfotransferase domain-containing protein [Steroidobacteraceae bacterium]